MAESLLQFFGLIPKMELLDYVVILCLILEETTILFSIAGRTLR